MVGNGLTVTVTCAVRVQPQAPVPVTVYVVVELGEAVTVEPVVGLSPVVGDHVYVFRPLAVSNVLCPMQIDTGGETIRGGGAGTTCTVP
jgi:hypothetical protein